MALNSLNWDKDERAVFNACKATLKAQVTLPHHDDKNASAFSPMRPMRSGPVSSHRYLFRTWTFHASSRGTMCSRSYLVILIGHELADPSLRKMVSLSWSFWNVYTCSSMERTTSICLLKIRIRRSYSICSFSISISSKLSFAKCFGGPSVAVLQWYMQSHQRTR